MSDDIMRGPQMDPSLAHETALDVEHRAQSLISAHVKQYRGNHARAELAGLYIVAKAYVLHNRFDEATLAALDERAVEMAREFRKP